MFLNNQVGPNSNNAFRINADGSGLLQLTTNDNSFGPFAWLAAVIDPAVPAPAGPAAGGARAQAVDPLSAETLADALPLAGAVQAVYPGATLLFYGAYRIVRRRRLQY